jgi:uncharacterized protein (DUF58 family)
MRPSRRLLLLVAAALALSVIGLSFGAAAGRVALAGWGPLGLAFGLDLLLSLRRRVTVEAHAPAELFTGATGELRLIAPRAPAGLRARIDWPAGLRGPEDIDFDQGEAAAPITAIRRGRWTIARLWLIWPSRLGLLEFVPRTKLDLTVAAIPDIRPVSSGLIDVQVRSALFGVKENFARGEGSEFHQLRDFATGMDTRDIDWKRSARHGALVAREMRAERNHHVIIALDNGRLMREELDGLPKIDHCINAALALTWAAGLGGDRVGLLAYDARPRLFVPPEPGRRAFAVFRSRAADLEYRGVEANHTLAMATLMARTPRRSLIVAFSDFADATTAELLVENVAALSRRHVVIFVAMHDPGLARVLEAAPDSLDDVARAVTAGEMLRERAAVMERLARLGVTVIDAPPRAITTKLISTWLDLKSREAI